MSNLIFSRTFQEISDMQQKKSSNNISSGGIVKPQATQQDMKLLAEYGKEGLKAKMFYGVLDRLANSAKLVK